MPIHFTRERLEHVINTHEMWWAGRLNRPLAQIRVSGAYEAGPKPPAPLLSQATCADFSWTAEQLIDTLDWRLSQTAFLGDACPCISFDTFGPGVLAAFCGAKLDNSSGGVWFFPQEEKPISRVHAVYDPDSVWVRRIKDIYRAGLERWQGAVIMSLPDLGGVLDVCASLVGTDALLYAMIDEPEEVERLVTEAHSAWYAAYADLAGALAPQGCLTDWNGLLSVKSAYVLQCDFCYMIGSDMFRRFALETLREDTRRLSHTIYHLDGVGELTHLDDILTLEDLNAVQWVYGAGQPRAASWLQVYQKILAAGKQIMIVDSERDFLDVYAALGGTPYTRLWYPAEQLKRAGELAERFAPQPQRADLAAI